MENGINTQLAMQAFSGTSMEPEKRGQQAIQSFNNELAEDYASLLPHATTEEKKEILEAEFAKYRGGYASRYNRWLSAHGRCLSTFITGGSNFPVRRAERANNAERGRLEDCIGYRKWALNEILKKLHPEWRPIMAGDNDAQERLKEKIKKAEDFQAKAKLINAAIRKNAKGGKEAQEKALKEMGFEDQTISNLLKPDWCGRIGIPGYELTNNNANLRRMKERLQKISKDQTATMTQIEGTNAKYEDCPADNRVRLFFPGKPAEEIRKELKSNGFRWSPTIGAWQAYRNQWTLEKAKKIAGIA